MLEVFHSKKKFSCRQRQSRVTGRPIRTALMALTGALLLYPLLKPKKAS